MKKINYLFIIFTLFNSKIYSLPAPPIFESVPHYPGICYLPPESGMCSSIVELKQKSENKILNDQQQLNNFSNEEEEKIKNKNKWETSIEEEEENEKENRRLFTKFYFDSVTSQCYAFTTQNCGGNQNRFLSIEECLDVCKLFK